MYSKKVKIVLPIACAPNSCSEKLHFTMPIINEKIILGLRVLLVNRSSIGTHLITAIGKMNENDGG